MEHEHQARRRAARRGEVLGLIALNAALLIILGVVTFAPAVSAQAVRSRGEYTMVAGGVNGQSADVVYIADVVNQGLIAITYSGPERQIIGLGARNLAADSRDLLEGRIAGGGTTR